jgi:WD40 repeat protein
VTDAVFSRDGNRVATANDDGYLRVWDGQSGKPVVVIRAHRLTNPVYSVSLGRAGEFVAAASWADARVWNARTGELVKVLHGHELPPLEIYVHSTAFSADGRFLVTAGVDGTARVWQATDWKQVAVLRGHSGSVLNATFNPDGTRVVTVGADGTARVWDSSTGEGLAVLRLPGGHISSAEFAFDGNRIVTATDDGVRVWEVSGIRAIRRITPPEDPSRDADFNLYDAVFSPDGRVVATLAERAPIYLWNVATGTRIARLRGHGSAASWPWMPASLSFSPNGRRVVTTSDETAIVWDARTGEPLVVLRGHRKWLRNAAFSPDGSRVLTTSADGTARTWDATTGKALRVLKIAAQSDDVRSNLVFSADGRLVAGHTRRGVTVWDVATGVKRAVLAGTLPWLVGAPAFSADGARIYAYTENDAATDGSGGVTRAGVWDAASGASVSVFRGGEGLGDGVFSADARLVLTPSTNGAVQVWEADTGEPVAAIVGLANLYEEFASRASFSPDGRLVLTSGTDGKARLWDAGTGERLVVLSGFVGFASFSPDGKLIVTVGGPSAGLYACEECGALTDLRRLADERVSRTITRRERKAYLRATRG